MTRRSMLKSRGRRAVLVLFLAACALAVTGWNSGTYSAAGPAQHNSGAGSPSRVAVIASFPKDVRALLTPDVPTPVISALLKIRRQGSHTLILNDSGGELFQAEQSAYVNNWQKLTGWVVKDIAPSPSSGQVKAQVDSGRPQFDMFETGSIGEAITDQAHKLLAPIDSSLMAPAYAKFPRGFSHTRYWVQYGWFGVVLMWDLKKWPMSGPHPTSATDLFNTQQFPGKRCLFKYPEYAGTLEYPLLADGVPFNRLYPLDVNRALAKLDTIKNDIVWWNSGAEPVQHIADGNCAIGVDWNGRPALRVAQDPSLPIGVSWKGTMLVGSAWAIPRGAQHEDAANSLLGYAFTTSNQCRFINTIGYGIPMNEKCINAFGRKWSATKANMAKAAGVENAQYYTNNIASLVTTFNGWLAK
jgi:putative spermidine/putrescine transport system substrate-binding protein